ncbi:MAG: CRISPR-associated helicase Cas3' [wastewater metagenome]|nr:CRISPR-associated helicase Cas3' [Candidatus Loosdrechtia aerotolerans]
MEITLPSSNLYSHPGRFLEEHLIGVAHLSELFLNEKPAKIKEQFHHISRIIALTHDIGKATSYFQKYLIAGEEEKKSLKNKKETNHSLFSSVCTYYLTKELKSAEIYPFFAFLTVRRHHGNLRDVMDDAIFDEEDRKLLYKQLESINTGSLSILGKRLFEAGLPMVLNNKIISLWIDDFVHESGYIRKYLRKMNDEVSHYININFLYSLLLDADKSDVVIRDTTLFERQVIKNDTWVDNYKVKTVFPISQINNLREKAYYEVTENDINLDNRIYSLNLPTGLGKTLTSLSFVLKLRETIKSQSNVNPRIVYALPFLSIIDQNAQVFESVIRANNTEPDTNILLKHHHLSEMFYKKDESEFETDEVKILIEGWNAEIIVTTFVQLFHTLISNRNKAIRKFHRLANAIIILDEVQSIPIKYWSLLRTVFTKFLELFNCYIMFVTATEPLIFEREEMKKLINRDFYFNSLDRVSMKPLLNKSMTINDLREYFDITNGKTYLFIFNTITSAKDFYNLVKGQEGVSSTYLSTHVTPKERLQRIQEIKTGEYTVVVSTQLVEAGVDIDFDIAVRDIAPLDSINQASGRCNRNGNNKGSVYIVDLKDSRGRRYASYIYDSVLLDITQKILANREEIQEKIFLELIESYYKETKIKKTQDVSKCLLEAITKLKYDSEDDSVSISDFKLIEEDYIKRDVFIEIDEEARAIWQRYINLKNIDDLFLRKNTFDSFKADFYQYVISIPVNVKNTPPMFGEMGYIKQPVLAGFYDKETGFITKDTKSVVIW